jgi:hypothetical protein
MLKLTLTVILSFQATLIFAQQNELIFEKGSKAQSRFWTGSTIAFQLGDKEWRKGEITRIAKDSFYISSVVIQYHLMGSDTIHYPPDGFSITDVYAMPKKGILIDYLDGRYKISTEGGHVHWYWIKSGWIFRVLAAGYVGLTIVNGLIQNDFSFSDNITQFSIAAGVFLVGFILKKTYTPVLRIGKKYHLSVLNLSK